MQKLNLHMFDRCLIAGVSLLIIGVLLLFKFYTYQAQEKQIELVQNVMQKMSESQQIQFESYVDEKVRILQTLAAYPEIYEMHQKKQKEFIEGKSNGLGFSHIFIMDMQGVGYYIDERVYRDQHKEPFFENIMQNDVYITEPFYKENGITIITACVSIYNEQQEKVGVLCGTIDVKEIQQLIEKNEMILDGKSFIVDKEGTFITEPHMQEIDEQTSLYTLENTDSALIREAFAEKENVAGTMLLAGEEYQVDICYLENYKWLIVQSIPVANIVERFEVMSLLQYVLDFLAMTLIFCIIRIIFCWKKSDKKMYTDALTKCNSRAACIRVMEQLENKRTHDITIAYMDLNKFKYVNDTFGHDKGDELLCIFSSVLMKIFGSIGFVGRMGGDEFIAMFMDISEAEIEAKWQEIENELKEQSKTLEFSYVITSSYGYATRQKGEEKTLEVVMQEADEKMYAYKVAQKANR